MSLQEAPPSLVGFTSKTKYRYDVFLSFRGEDTRHSFIARLYDSLRQKGINTFIDDMKLGKGERISPALRKAIEKSRISIIVFSKNYATSTWCLDELTHIIRCKKQNNQLVMPIFYDVDPVDVQCQRKSFGKAMAAQKERFRNDPEKVREWRYALSEAALSKPQHVKDGYDDGVFIESIVEDAFARLPPKRFHNVDYIVGLEPCKEEVKSLLSETDDRVCMLGIYGTGGIGKTTLAKAVYSSIFYHFEGACFLFDVKEASRKYLGIVHLQQKLLLEILGEKIMIFPSAHEGISRIKHRLSHKRVLLVLDDVDEIEQLEQLAGGRDWFGYGSKVIITTRNKQLLIAHNVKKTYEMMKLDEHHSLELFCWHAFHMNQPPKNYQDMSSWVISYAQGLPLALRVIGSNLACKNLEEWRSVLEQYERIPERTIHEVLKISYDCLQDGAKRIFLDIACFVHDEMLGSIEEIVEACDFGGRFYLEVLIDKSLITFAENDGWSIHDLIRQMGREIVRQEAPLNPEKRSRLWDYKDALKVLCTNLGCNKIEGIMLDPPQQKKLNWTGTTFEKMNNLRILVVRNVQFSTVPTYLPNSLKWLEWEGYPSATLPTKFSPLGLVFLKLPRSSFRLKEPFKSFTNSVTQMNFSYCEFITEVPDMSQLRSLRKLDIAHCSNLIKVDDSVGSLSKLVQLNAVGCIKLSIFPREIKMPSLKRLNLKYCRSLDYFPRIEGKMDALMAISIEDSAIKDLPPSIGNLSRLESLSMYSCKSLGELPTSISTLPNLVRLDLGDVHPHTRKSFMKLLVQDSQPIISYYMKYLQLINCGVLDEELNLILNCFRNLRELYVSMNDFVSLPKGIKDCAELRRLHVTSCKMLRHIPELPSKLRYIEAENCTSLTAESLDNLYSQAKKELSRLIICMQTKTFPDWFNYCCEGGTLCFRARRCLPRAILALELGKPNKANIIRHPLLVSMTINGRKITEDNLPLTKYYDGRVILFDLFMDMTEKELKELHDRWFMGLDWNYVRIQVISEPRDISIVIRFGFYLYKQHNIENVQFESPLVTTTSLKRRAIASPPNEPPKKLLRKFKAADKGKLNNTKRRTRRIKRHHTFHSWYKRRMVFPVGKLVWSFLYH